MRRGLCAVSASFGLGMGQTGLLVRFRPAPAAENRLRSWLVTQALPSLPAQPGLGSVHLLEGALSAPMTNEQRIRGADAGVDWAILVTGYDTDALAELSGGSLGEPGLAEQGATDVEHTTYRMHHSLSQAEVVG
jgi:hypothetical protein